MLDKAYFDNLNYEEVLQILTLEDVENFLKSLGVEKIERGNNYLCCPTICHNPIEKAVNMKLYYYGNHRVFHCYTECGDSFNIYELYKRYNLINYNREPLFDETVDYIRQFLTGTKFQDGARYKSKESGVDREKYERAGIVELKEYSKNVLDVFQDYKHPIWLREGISKESMSRFGIGYYASLNEITIPHYDVQGRLVGVRVRALEENDLVYGKYRPVKIGNNEYRHQLSWNLYGIYEHKKAIQKYRRAVIVEGEKSVLKSDTYFGEDSIAVACCGSQINRAQIRLLVGLGVSEIIIGLDKEYEKINSEKARKYRAKLVSICNKYKDAAKFSYIFDEENLLDEKDSPYDKGKEIFLQLYNKRITVKG